MGRGTYKQAGANGQLPETLGVVEKSTADFQRRYKRACKLAETGKHVHARRLYERLFARATNDLERAIIRNDLAALAAVVGSTDAAHSGFEEALALDPNCEKARTNLALLLEREAGDGAERTFGPQDTLQSGPPTLSSTTRIGIISFLFNWPSTGGGIIHTIELAKFLSRAGFDVCIFFPRYEPWGVGNVKSALPVRCDALEFDEKTWRVSEIQRRFRSALDSFVPDYVLITDCWNMKPHLADAMRGYRTFLRFQALECLCPLNNLRLLADDSRNVTQCPLHQLATPQECCACLRDRGHLSGPLHKAERELAGVGSRQYHELLCRTLREAEAVLVLNPLTEAMLSPYARQVRWGMDQARFPWPPFNGERNHGQKLVIFQAGVVDELIKGFHVLHSACERIWKRRQDFELVATGDPCGPVDDFTRFTGWTAQDELPQLYSRSDIVVVPTIAQDGLSRTSVEAMAAGKPVVASRIGGVPYTVQDGATGLLFEPGNPDDLAQKLECLLDDPDLRQRFGVAGRRRFEEHFTWDVVIERYYRPLLASRKTAIG